MGAAVQKKTSFRFAKLAAPLISLLIVGFIALQFIASFNLLCPPSSIFSVSPRLYQLLYNCGSGLWPFISYPMYSRPRYEGDQINQRYVYAILKDSTEVRVLPEDLGIDRNLFGWFINALIEDDTEYIENYVAVYENRHSTKLSGLRLENHPLVLTREGLQPGSIEVLVDIRFDNLAEVNSDKSSDSVE